MGHLITVASCQLDQWALDWEGNCERIIQSIIQAKQRGASLRVGPELEITGYGLLDHFLESDTFLHSWEMYARILEHPDCQSILLDVGMPVMHKGVRFNCRIISYSKRILLIRPKIWLANDGNYREMRYFTPWLRPRFVETFSVPRIISSITGQQTVPIGDAIISTADTTIGSETCEEMFTPDAPNIAMGLDGVEIFTNSSGSHHELRKLDTRISIITEATRKGGGIYLYANQRGCDGDRLYYDGCCLIIVNGKVLAQGTQFSLNDVEVITATIDLEDVRSYRSTMSRCLQAVANNEQYQRIRVLPETVSLSLPYSEFNETLVPTEEIKPRIHIPQEEIALGPACWLWDYLRRSKGYGYFLALSGGIDSCSTAIIVFSMCRIVLDGIKSGNQQVLKDLNFIVFGNNNNDNQLWVPESAEEICYHLFHTTYMGTENSSNETRKRAKELSNAINGYHVDLNMDIIVKAFVTVFTMSTNKQPKFKIYGGSNTENLALQNIQARTRMVLSYLYSQLLPWARGNKRGSGGLLVLSSSNVDECLRGYLTKYDCSSADLNPIGSISKTDLKSFIQYAMIEFNLPILQDFLNATPTAELEPITKNYVQSDEADMGMTYKELSEFGRLRKIEKCGPYSMFTKLYHKWSNHLTGNEIMDKVLRFFYFYAINRHKQTILTPSYHAEQYSPDDNRFDLRPFLLDPFFTWPRKKIQAFLSQVSQDKQD